MPLKTEFDLMTHRRQRDGSYKPEVTGSIYILPKTKAQSGKKMPVRVHMRNSIFEYHIKSKDLERFAVNILKALGSKKLSFSERYNNKKFFRNPRNKPTHG